MRSLVKAAVTSIGMLAGAGALCGCGGEDKGDAAKTAEKALGVDENKTSSATKEKHDVLVVEEKKVQDAKTGEVLSTEKTVTPVTVEKAVTTDYKAKSGEARTTPAPKP